MLTRPGAKSPEAVEKLFQEGQAAVAGAEQQMEILRAGGAELPDEQRAAVSQLETEIQAIAATWSNVTGHWEGVKERYQVGERIIHAQEEAWRRVAREIHDGPAQSMANIVLRAEICERLMAAGRPEINQELAQLKLLVKESLREVRKIIFDLRPMALDDLGLVPTLHRYLENMREQGDVPVSFAVDGEERRLDSTLEVALFRVTQEAVNNARKHAQATKIEVEVVFTADLLTVTVEDDGIGFDMDQVKEERLDRQSFGLMSMRERIELLGGEFSIQSQVGEGTTVVASVPCKEHEASEDE